MRLRSRTRKLNHANPDLPKFYNVYPSTTSFQPSPCLPPKLREKFTPSQVLDFPPSLPPKRKQSTHVPTFTYEITPCLPPKVNISNKPFDVNVPNSSSHLKTPTSSHACTIPILRKFPK